MFETQQLKFFASLLMRPIIFKLFLLVFSIIFAVGAAAQTCTGSLGDPVINETFGAGTTQNEVGPALPYGVTTLQYSPLACVGDIEGYTFVSYMYGCHASTWQHLNNDHTGNPFGYFMLINGPDGGGDVYDEKVAGDKLCPNTTYEFAAWIMNVLILQDSTKNWVLPNLTFSIETAAGKVLKTLTIGDIAETVNPVWNHYGTFFTTPSDGSDIVVRLIDNQMQPGNGNDFAVDDITFRPCGPVVEAGFDSATGNINETMCAGNNATYTLKATQAGYDSPAYQWQQNLNDGNGWVDISGETGTAVTINLNGPKAGTYLYRIGVSSGTNTSLSCRIYSQVLTVFINPFPVADLPALTPVCIGQPLRLTVAQADSYAWTGPNNFSYTSETANSVLVTDAASSSNDGTYTVITTKGGCPLFQSTNVVVYPPVGSATVNNATICEGDMATLTVQCPGATQYSWAPSTGLKTTDGATVTASPDQTTTYTVTIGNGGCDVITRSATVTVITKPAASAGGNKKIMSGESVMLNGSVTGDNVSYYWTPPDYLDNANSLTPIASPAYNTTYTLHAVSNYTCGEDTSSTFVRVYQTVKIPNTFSPNNDGINDNWDIKNLGTYPGSSISVFNRWGQQVYQSIDYPKPWNGTDNGSPLPEGTYYYVIDLKNGMPKLAGWVLIVR